MVGDLADVAGVGVSGFWGGVGGEGEGKGGREKGRVGGLPCVGEVGGEGDGDCAAVEGFAGEGEGHGGGCGLRGVFCFVVLVWMFRCSCSWSSVFAV